MRSWYPPLALALGAQVVTSLADMAVPVLGPVIMADAGVPATYVGYYASAVAAGAVAFYGLGTGIVHRAGPVRVLRAGVLVCALGLLLLLAGNWWLIVAAGLMIGLGFGTNTPAAGVLLHVAVPKKRRHLAFSIKQAGMPIGALLAGFSLPVLAALWSWQAAVGVAAGAGCLLYLVAGRFRAPPHARDGGSGWSDPRALAALVRRRPIRRLMICGALLATAQGGVNAYLVTYLVEALGLTLVTAGSLYAWLHLIGIPARVASGWLADREPVRVLRAIGAVSALAVALFALLTPQSSLALVALSIAALGLVIGSWNGVLLALASDIAPSDRIAEANSVAAIGAFAGFILGPMLFAWVVTAGGSFSTALLLLAAGAALSIPVLPRRVRPMAA